MKALYRLISSAIVILTYISGADAHTLRLISGNNGLYGIEAIDNNTGKVTAALPIMFQRVILSPNAGDPAVAKIAERTFVALDTNLHVMFGFPNTIDEVYGFNGGICIVKGPGYETGYGAIDDQGNIIMKPEYDYVGLNVNNSIVGFRSVTGFSDTYLSRVNCFEVHRIGRGKGKNESFVLNVPYLRLQNAHYNTKILPVLFSADSISRYIQYPLDHTVASGINKLINGDYQYAKTYFRKALRSEDADEELAAAMKYNLMVCKVMGTGRYCRLPKRDNLHEYEIDAALSGLYGQKAAGFFKSHYELYLLCADYFYPHETLPYADYSGKLYYDRDFMNPLRTCDNGMYRNLLKRRDAFVLSESVSQIPYNELDAIIVSVNSDGTGKFCTCSGNVYPDSRFRLSYYLDIRLFMQALVKEYQLTELIMVFPY